jgi:hypothetical protein
MKATGEFGIRTRGETCENLDFHLFSKNTSDLNTGNNWWKKR